MLIPLGVLDFPTGEVPVDDVYDLLETEILISPQASVTFGSLNSTYGADYQHLQIRGVVKSSSTGNDDVFTVDTGASSYDSHTLGGNGSSSFSLRATGFSGGLLGFITNQTYDANEFSPFVTDLLDFSSSNKNKTFRTFTGFQRPRIYLSSSLAISTSPIDSLTLSVNTGNIVTGSRFSLYGLRSA